MGLLSTSDDGTVSETHNLVKFLDDITTAAEKVACDLRVAPKFGELLKEARFENVNHKVFKLPMGPWPKDRRLKMIGFCHRERFLQGLSGIAMGLFDRLLNWSRDYVEVYLTQVRKDFADPRIHGYWRRLRACT